MEKAPAGLNTVKIVMNGSKINAVFKSYADAVQYVKLGMARDASADYKIESWAVHKSLNDFLSSGSDPEGINHRLRAL